MSKKRITLVFLLPFARRGQFTLGGALRPDSVSLPPEPLNPHATPSHLLSFIEGIRVFCVPRGLSPDRAVRAVQTSFFQIGQLRDVAVALVRQLEQSKLVAMAVVVVPLP